MTDPEDEKFQSLLLQSACSDCVSICVLPHIEVFLSPTDVASLLSLMRVASKEDASWDDQNARSGRVAVEYMNNDSSIILFGDVSINNLTDSQWISVYQGFVEWQDWSAKQHSDEWRFVIPPNNNAYALFDESLSDEEVSAMIRQTFVEIFDRSGVDLQTAN